MLLSFILFGHILLLEKVWDWTSSKHATLFLEKGVWVGIKDSLFTADISTSIPTLLVSVCLSVSRYSLGISYVLGTFLGPGDAMVDSDKSPAFGKPILVVSEALETLQSKAES